MNIIEVQESLKDLPDNALMQEMQNPTGSAPQFLVLSELKRRKRMRDDYQRRQAGDIQTVAEEAVTAAGAPQEGIMQVSRAMNPNSSIAQNTGMDQSVPQEPVQAPQMMADGGIIKLAPGGSVGRPVEPFPANSPNPRDRSNWMAMYKDTHNLDGSPKYLSPDVAQSEGIEALSADVDDYMAPGMRMNTQDKLSAALGDVDRRVPRSLAILASPEDQDVVRGPEVEAAMETQNVLEEMMKANQGIARDETPTGQLNVDALGNVLGFNPEDPTVGGEALRLAEAAAAEAPLDIERSNLDAQMGTQRIGIGTDPSIRDALPEGVREDDLRFSRGTSSIGSASDPVSSRDAPLSFVDLAQQYAAIKDDTTRPELYTDAPAGPISMPIGNKGGMYSFDEQGNVVGGDQSYGARFGFTPSIDEPVGATQESIDSAEEVAEIREAQGITDASNSVGALLAAGDEAAAQEIIENARKAVRKDEETPDPDIDTSTAPAGRKSTSTSGGAGGGVGGRIAQMLADREKSAEADKWMALAQAGMALMASDQPTFGGALGEAGLVGVGAMQKARKQYEDDILDLLTLQQRANAASSRKSGGLTASNMITHVRNLRDYKKDITKEIGDINLDYSLSDEQKAAQLERLQSELMRIDLELGTYSKALSGGGTGGSSFDVRGGSTQQPSVGYSLGTATQ